MFLPSRSPKKEQLDDLSLSGKKLIDALKSLRFINTFFGNHFHIKTAVSSFCKRNPSLKELTIVDLGCGGGDVLYMLEDFFRQKNIKVRLIGIDGNPNSISYATSQQSNSTIEFKVADILDPNFEIPNCDIILSSHFIYHFEHTDLINFLYRLKKANQTTHVIFSELRRCKFGYYTFKIFQHLLPISTMAKQDGLLALKRTFSFRELKNILRCSQVPRYSIRRKPFFRMVAAIDF